MIFDKLTNFFGKFSRNKERNYQAAGRKARYGDFSASRGSADYELRAGLATVRAKCRNLARNSSSMVRFIQLMNVNVVGESGFLFKSRVRKINGDSDVALNDRVQEAWNDWCEQPTTDGVMNFTDLCEQMVETWCRDGEVIWEVVKGSDYNDGIAINPIEADLLDETLNTVASNGNHIRMGVEVRDDGRPVAYHFLQYHPGDSFFTQEKFSQRHRRVPADRIIHIYKRKRPGQTRGEPPAAPIVNRVVMLDGYRESETMGRRLKAAIMGFFVKDRPVADGIKELADGVDKDDNIFEMDVEPGKLMSLPEGMRLEKFDPGGSLSDYAQFEAQIKKDISMGLGLSNFSHGQETQGVSYSTGRSVLLEDRDFYSAMQSWFVRTGVKKVFQLWLSMNSLQDGSKIPPSRLNMIRKNCVFMGRGWGWVDPQREVKANFEALASGQTSLTRVAAGMGIDRDALLDEIEDDARALKLRGLTLNYHTDKDDDDLSEAEGNEAA